MLVVFGANGRTGVEILKEAKRRGVPVRPVVRDDQDTKNLDYLVPVADVFYADPESPDSLPHCVEGATWVISCIDARTAGPGAPIYTGEAARNIIMAAAKAGAERILHLSIMGAYRWSYAPLNRKSFHLESAVRACNAPWGLLRISCYFDEVIEGHVAPPDGGKPWPFAKASRYAPTSRRDAALMAFAFMDRFVPGRAQPAGGPEVLSGEQLADAVAGSRIKGKGKTRYVKLPPGDVSVALTTTRGTIGFIPDTTLADALAGREAPEAEPDVRTVYPHGDPKRPAADAGGGGPILDAMGEDLRRVVHVQLVNDLARIGQPTDGVTLDFAEAEVGDRSEDAHHGRFSTLSGVRVLASDGAVLHEGAVDFLRDKLAEEFYCWWGDIPSTIPDDVWERLDMGVRRRLSRKGAFVDDPKAVAFRS